MNVEDIIDIQERYQDIPLNFGKYKGKTLKEVIKDEKGQSYLIWLHGEMKKNEKQTPTQRAIMKYISAVYEL